MPWQQIEPNELIHLLRETAAVTWTVSGGGYVLDVPDWCRLKGQTPDEAKGSGWMNALHPGDRPRVDAAWRTAVVHGSHFNTDYRLRCADGIYRWVNARGVPVLNPDGWISHWVGVILMIAGTNRFDDGSDGRVAAPLIESAERVPPSTIRAARALVDWSAQALADRSGISLSTVRRLESEGEGVQARSKNVSKVISALTQAGVEFIQEAGTIVGVRLAEENPLDGAVGDHRHVSTS